MSLGVFVGGYELGLTVRHSETVWKGGRGWPPCAVDSDFGSEVEAWGLEIRSCTREM